MVQLANTNKIKIVTPVGRLLQGSVFTGQTTDQKGVAYAYKRGAKTGQPYSKYIAVIGIEKSNPEWPEFWAKIHAVAVAGFPQLFDPAGNPLREFHWKYVDGDSTVPDQGGHPPCQKPGFPGHHVLRFTVNGFAPRACSRGGMEILTDPASIKRGDYIRIVGTVEPNGDVSKPGLYVEQKLIEFIGYGQEISTGGMDAKAELAQAAVGYIPAGMSSTPMAPASVPAVPQAQHAVGVPGYQPSAAFAPAATRAPANQPVAFPSAPPQTGQPNAFAPPPSHAAPAVPGTPPGFLNPEQIPFC